MEDDISESSIDWFRGLLHAQANNFYVRNHTHYFSFHSIVTLVPL